MRPIAGTTVSPHHDARQVAELLALPQITRLIADHGETRWADRPGYPIRTMIGAALVKAVYALPTWTRTTRLITEHTALRGVLGGAPSHWACYRFAGKLRDHGSVLQSCLDSLLTSLREAHPQMGQTVAIDGSDMPAFANDHKHVGSSKGPLRTRPVAQAELGMTPSDLPADLGLHLPTEWADTVAVSTALWRADAQQRRILMNTVFASSAVPASALRWLTSPLVRRLRPYAGVPAVRDFTTEVRERLPAAAAHAARR